LDARTVDFDGFVANSFELPFGHPLEDKLFDFDDTGALGQIFTASLNGLDSNQLLPEQFLRGLRGRGGGAVTITGLPLAALRGNAFSPLDLANIAPAAGGNRQASADDLNNIETAAGGGLSPEQLNDIDSEAGSQNVACWGGVTNVSSPVTYNLSEDPGAMMSDAANCAQSGSSL
jgi:hypothetical protein